MALIDVSNLLSTSDTRLFDRSMAAVMIAAGNVVNEDPGTTNHTNRLAWARAALASRDGLRTKTEQMYIGIVSNTSIQASGQAATDGDIQYVVNSLVDTYATGA